MTYNLFLDDIRMAYDVADYILPIELRIMYRVEDWVIVRSYNKFLKYIKKNGLPNKISFDHDLADEHYAPKEIWKYPEKVRERISKGFKEKTGYDCAKWLVEYCQEKGLILPKYYCHSMNPVGKENILNLLDNFKNKY